MSWGEDERDTIIEWEECPVCEETRRYFYGKKHEKKYMCYSCYWKTQQGKRETAKGERLDEYETLRAEFEGEIQRKKRYEKLKREFDRRKKNELNAI